MDRYHKITISPNMQINMEPNIGLENNARQSIVEILNVILADEAILAFKTRSANWNVRGASFFELHTLFENQYKQINTISDEVAERAQMLGGLAVAGLSVFSKHTRLEEQIEVIPGLLQLLADHEAAIRFFRGDAAKCTEEFDDEGTFDLLVSVIRQHEKMAWVLRSFTE